MRALVNISAALLSQVELQLAKYLTKASPDGLVPLMSVLYLLLHLPIARLLHDIKGLFGLLEPILGQFHVFKHFLSALFQLIGGRNLSWYELLLIWVIFHGLHPLVQVNWSSIEVSRHVLSEKLGLLLIDRPKVRNLVVQARSKAIL